MNKANQTHTAPARTLLAGLVAIIVMTMMGIDAQAQTRTQTQAQMQRFYNLSAADVAIGDRLPQFAISVPLPEHYADSVYTATLLYPEFIDMSATDIQAYHQLVPSGSLPAMPTLDTHMVFDRKRAQLETSFCPLVYRDGKYRILVSFMLKVESKARHAQSTKHTQSAKSLKATLTPAERYASHSVLAEGRWAKIRVSETGVYQISDALIRQAGFTDLSKVKLYGYGGNLINEQLVPSELIAQDDLKEVPTCNIAGRRLFFAKGPVSWDSKDSKRRTRNPYSDYGYYFLTQDNASEPATVDSTTFVNSFYPTDTWFSHSLHEVDAYAWYEGGRNLFDSRAITSGNPYTVTLATNANATQAQVTVNVSAGTHAEVQLSFNGEDKGSITVNIGNEGGGSTYNKGSEASKTFTVNNLSTEKNQLTITTTSGGPVRLDYIDIQWDKPLPLPSLATNVPTPQYVYNITNQDHHADPQADMVIIIPTSQKLRKQAERLKALREENDGLRVNLVPADELYNEFSSGTPDASAYRRYLKMLYDRAQTDADLPRYLLLFGDCVWDNRLLTSACKSLNADDLLLCHESENSFSQTTCYVDDGFFALLDDGEGLNPDTHDKLDMAVGRFPVYSETDAKAMVDKTIAYSTNTQGGAWQNTLVFMGDDGNNNLHMRDENETAEMINALHPGFIIKKVMWDAYKRETSATGNAYPDVTRTLKQLQQQGALIMDYAGHGKATQISHENALRLNDFNNFTNTNLPLWITASCDIMAFDGTEENIGEQAVRNAKGGAVAFFGTTRTVFTNYNKVINQAYLKHVLSTENGQPISIGEAQRRAKNQMIEDGADRTVNKLQYSLLGDPALKLALPSRTMVVDEINGVAPSADEPVVLKAGSIATIKGHIEGDDSFTGIANITVRDARELVTCRMNDAKEPEGAKSAFTFYDRSKTIYTGNDSIRAGQFAFTFAVPKDISYSDDTGLINLHAISTDRKTSANGWCDRFVANGSDINDNDSIGPSIYCYLNSPSFSNGDRVNPTPYFVARITDQNGINAAGSGIGHDLQLIIDGDMQHTYNLNENFSYDFGSYTSGSTFYALPELEPGQHRLLFRAWDVYNNPSTTELTFTVVKGLKPNLFSISCTNNPAHTSTTFSVNHDRMGSNVNVAIDVFDMSGRHLWTHSENGVSEGSAYTVNWNLTLDNGAALQTGVYLYRVRIGSDGSAMTSKAKKLVVVRQ